MTRMPELQQIASECREASDTYMKYPGMAGAGANAGTIADIYATIARLAEHIAKLEGKSE